MGRIFRSCLQSVLKLVNSIGGLVGVGSILYSLWMLRVWYRDFHADPTPPWFICAFLGLGVSLCLIACSGHIASETTNGHCLSCYMVLVFVLLMLEAAVTADIMLNGDWEEDFPVDITGRFKELKHFIKSNFDFCKWIGFAIVAAQATCIFLASILKALGPHRESYYDSDDDSATARLPLLRSQVQHSPYPGDPHVTFKGEPWNVR